jgi:transposase-like protein
VSDVELEANRAPARRERRRWTVEESAAIGREAFAPGARVAAVARRRAASRAQLYRTRTAVRVPTGAGIGLEFAF